MVLVGNVPGPAGEAGSPVWVAPAGTPPGDTAAWQLAGRIDAAQLDQLAKGFTEAGRVLGAHLDRLAKAWTAALAPLAAQLAPYTEAQLAAFDHFEQLRGDDADEMRWQPGDWTGP